MKEALSRDPRLIAIESRLSEVKKIIPMISSKGGVGKSLISAVLALRLARTGKSVGLMDLDITNPTAHIILGVDVDNVLPEEEKGIKPPIIASVKFMTIAFYSGENPLPLRGDEISSAIREILTITRWGRLDYLIMDMPPGMADELLEVMSYIKKAEPVLITTPSPLSIASAKRIGRLFQGSIPISGIIENMADMPTKEVLKLAEELGTRYLGNIPYIKNIDENIGQPDKLLVTEFASYINTIIEKLEE
jgi:ATP-binding protein involved in chromosome partitioning